MAWAVAGSLAAVVNGGGEVGANVRTAGRGLRMGRVGSLTGRGYLFALQFDLADNVRGEYVGIFGVSPDVDPSSIRFGILCRELDSPPYFVRCVLVKRGVEAQSRAPQNAGRGW